MIIGVIYGLQNERRRDGVKLSVNLSVKLSGINSPLPSPPRNNKEKATPCYVNLNRLLSAITQNDFTIY